MPDNSGEFAALMERIRQGSEGAAEELVARHGPDILRVVRRRLSRRIRSKFDSADFTQSVWRSFFANAARTQEIRHPDELAAYLAEMAKNKVIDAFRRSLQTKKRDLNRERSLDSAALSEPSHVFAAAQPTPSHELAVKEEWDRVKESKPVYYQDILDLLRQGYNAAQIADQLGVHTQSIRRAIRKLFPREAS
ncbi:MAG TPA: sigma-70 family RNA polymerase sigma factor [Gemmataceae bacterium]|nr:sigma-70 family RNA polymerase sigma factor [Gemmataceae bacterium]